MPYTLTWAERVLGMIDVADVAGAEQISNIMLSIAYTRNERSCWSPIGQKVPRTVSFQMSNSEECSEAVRVIINMSRDQPLLGSVCSFPLYSFHVSSIIDPTTSRTYQPCKPRP